MGAETEEYDLTPIFYPKSLAVIGLSRRDYTHPGNTTFSKNYLEMKVKTYGVSPTAQEVDGYKTFPSIDKLPEIPDLAVFCVSAKNCLEAVTHAAEFGVKGGIIIGGGFAETGKEGREIQDQIVKVATDHHMPLIGPNCVGVYSPPIVDTIFLPTERIVKPKEGNVAFISQSGGVLLDQFFLSCYERDIGVSSAVSIGNKAMIKETHLLKYFEKDPKTNVIALYLEGFEPGEGREFVQIAKKSKKDIVVYMGGNSQEGKIAATSHTGSLAGNMEIMMAAFRQHTIVVPKTELEVKNFIKVYSVLSNPFRRYTTMSVQGDNIAVLSVSGGHGVMCADILGRYNLKLSKFSEEQKAQMQFLLNPTAARIAGLNNPIDLTGACEEDDLVKILEYLLQQMNVSLIILLLLPYPPQISMHLGRKVTQISGRYTKPIVTFLPWTAKYDLLRTSLEINYIPCAHTVEEAVMMANAIVEKGKGGIRKKFNWAPHD
jgi:acetyltransferase